jgi:hypothetical protein
MHFHYYTLRHLGPYLEAQHQGEQVIEVFSQNKNELVIELGNGFLRVGCHTPLSYIVPVQEFARARKNVVELFPEVHGRIVKGCRVLAYERVLILDLDDGFDLVFKMHAAGANVILRKDREVIRLFINRHEADLHYEEAPGAYHPEARNPASEPTDELAVLQAMRAISPIYEKQFARKVWLGMEGGLSFAASYAQVEQEMDDDVFYVQKEPQRIRFLPFEPGEDAPVARVQGVAQALHLYLRSHFQYTRYLSQYKQLSLEVRKPLEKYRKIFAAYRSNVSQLETERNPEEIGHLIMAHLHALSPGLKSVELEDFYHSGTIEIKLKPELNPQENAARYYEKSRQRKGKLSYLRGQLVEIEAKLLAAEAEMERFERLPEPGALTFSDQGFDYDQIKLIRKASREQTEEQQETDAGKSPFRTFEKDGYRIFVGKSAKNNDELSFHFASKDDLWLHAKDVAGSHVIIRQRAGQNIPAPVLEYAAGLAAWFSKRKNDGLVPVQYTLRKYIRKRKGDAPGKVAVDRESVIMVEPVKP